RTSPNMLDHVKVRSESGELVPLSTFARFKQGKGLNNIQHTDRRRVVRISANNQDRSAVEITNELKGILDTISLADGYEFDYSGDFEETEESFASLKLAYLVAFLLIFTLLVSQFNSMAQPFAILTALPLSIIGAMVGLLVTKNDFTIMSFIGLVGLSGIVVNDSIVLVDCINRMKGTGLNMFDAIVAAGQQRLRPIISTTVSTIGGILTLTLTDKLWEGLGVVLIFGIGFATVLTLVVVPIMYSLFEGLGHYVVSAFRGPRWKEVPEGKSYFYSRRRYIMQLIVIVFSIQVVVFALGMKILAPVFIDLIHQTSFHAPTGLKLAIEVTVFFMKMTIEAIGIIVFLMIPSWGGLIFFMAQRSREGYFVVVTPDGLTLGNIVDKVFLKKGEIDKIRTSRFFPSIPWIRIYSGKRKIVIRKLVEAERTTEKKPLITWLREPAPTRLEIREGMMNLKRSLEALVRA
ncbi:MAG: efflux RND transporter permease subunit, partial [Thermodesulfobacteriota bacterium]|nr:efflux RND transporter permease subunit [Thermodesulfobacteriota bacterium]